MKLQIFTAFSKFPNSTLERFPLIFLINILGELGGLEVSENGHQIFEKARNLLVFHLQKQEFEGFKRILEILVLNEPTLKKLQFNDSLILDIIRETFTYYSLAISLELLPFLDLIHILLLPPFKLTQEFLKTGLNLKLNNKRYFNSELTFIEIRAILALDAIFHPLQAFIQKSLQFSQKYPMEFNSFSIEEQIKILISSYQGRFELDFGLLADLEESLSQRIRGKYIDSLAAWVKIGVYYCYNDNHERFREVYNEKMMLEMVEAMENGLWGVRQDETLIFLEKARNLMNEAIKNRLEKLLDGVLEEVGEAISIEDSRLLLVSSLYSQNKVERKLEILDGISMMINEKSTYISSLVLLFKTVDLLQVSADVEKLRKIKARLEFLLKVVLKTSQLHNIMKTSPFEFVELISIKLKLQTVENKREDFISIAIEKNIDVKTLSFNNIAFLNMALRRTPEIHHYFLGFFERKIKEINKPNETERVVRPIELDLEKIRFLIKSFEAFEPMLRDCRLRGDQASVRYVGQFQVVLEALQEAMLARILKEVPRKHRVKNPFEKEMEKNKLEDENLNNDIQFKNISSKELEQVFGIFQSLAVLNLAYLPIYFMAWKLVEKSLNTLSLENLINWLYLLGNCNRLPKEFPKEITENLMDFQKTNDKSLDFCIKFLWVLILKNPEEIPRQAIEILSKRIKNNEKSLKSVSFDCRMRFFQIIQLLAMGGDMKTFDKYLGVSNENIQILKENYRDFLLNSRKTRKEAIFSQDIEKFLKKAKIPYEKNVILEYEGDPVVIMDFQINKEGGKGFLFIMDPRVYLGSSNVELVEGWVIRRLLKGLKIKTKFMEFKAYMNFERRHEKNSYIKAKVKSLGFDVDTKRKSIFE